MRNALAVLTLPLALVGPAPVVRHSSPRSRLRTRVVRIAYRAHDGRIRPAFLLLPRGYRGRPIPLVISPHGRNISARGDAAGWGDLPGEAGFAVICPGGEGRRLGRFSWGAPAEIADLARMPEVAAAHGVHVERRRVYAVGGSMGGQETLLLVARHPHLLAGAAAFDPVTDMARRYWGFGRLPGGAALQRLARLEVGGSPLADPSAYAARSPDRYARAIAMSHVPLQIYWSSRDGVIAGERSAIHSFAVTVDRLNRHAEVRIYRGDWHHCAEMKPRRELARALARLGLLPWRLGLDAGYLARGSAPGLALTTEGHLDTRAGERVTRPGEAEA